MKRGRGKNETENETGTRGMKRAGFRGHHAQLLTPPGDSSEEGMSSGQA
jgi:hypothetical protein